MEAVQNSTGGDPNCNIASHCRTTNSRFFDKRIIVKAFTLIELLVVVAIIAIIAAILFPMFAQAKETAKTNTAVSSMKQVGTSTVIYLGDYDDRLPPLGRYYKATDPVPDYSIAFKSDALYSTWALLIYPYVKNTALYYLPYSSSSRVPKPDNPIARATRFGDIGFNYCHLNIVDRTQPGNLIGLELSAIDSYANTVAYASRTPASYLTPKATLRSDYGFVTLMQVEPPVNPGGHCAGGWGKQSMWLNKGMFTEDADEDSGVATGLYATMFSHKGVICHLDSSCKSFSASQAAIGANCGALFTGATSSPECILKDKGTYKWDIE